MGVGKHLSVGSYYIHKSYPGKYYKFTSHDDSTCAFKHTPLFGPEDMLQSSFDKLREWKAYRGNLPALCPDDLVTKLLPHSSTAVKNELLKAKAYAGLLDAYLQHPSAEKLLVFGTDPDAVFVCKDVKKGELQLFPCGTLSLPKDGAEPDMQCKPVCKSKGNPAVFVINPPKCSIHQGEAKEGSIICPFFWVKAGDAEAANMQLSSFTHESWFSIPVLVNTKPIQKNSQLVMLSTSLEAVKEQAATEPAKGTKRKPTDKDHQASAKVAGKKKSNS